MNTLIRRAKLYAIAFQIVIALPALAQTNQPINTKDTHSITGEAGTKATTEIDKPQKIESSAGQSTSTIKQQQQQIAELQQQIKELKDIVQKQAENQTHNQASSTNCQKPQVIKIRRNSLLYKIFPNYPLGGYNVTVPQ